MPYTSLNGHIVSNLTWEGMVALRLPTEPWEDFLEKYKKELSGGYGSVMKEYAVVPKSLLKKTDELKEYFEISYTYVGSLKPTSKIR